MSLFLPRHWSRAWITGGWLLVAAGFAGILLLGPLVEACDEERIDAAWCAAIFAVLALGAPCLIYAGNRSVIRGRTIAALVHHPSARTAPAVLYLRPFVDDLRTGKGLTAFGWSWISPAPFTEEEQLVEVLAGIGPVAAVGKPGEALPPLGAQRLYFSQSDWARHVAELMAAAKLVVLRAGSTEGVSWELDHALRHIDLRRLVILLPFNERQHQAFYSRAEATLGRTLPAWPTVPRNRLLRRLLRPLPFGEPSAGVMLYFDAGRSPVLVPLRHNLVPFLRRSWTRPAGPIFRMAFRPIFQSLGFDTVTPPLSPLTVGCLVLFVIDAVMIVVGLVTP